MVHPYIKRRNGQEKVTFPSEKLKEILGKTLGVPLFQEQAIQIAMKGAGFSLKDTDRLRRSLATFKRNGTVNKFKKDLLMACKKWMTRILLQSAFLRYRVLVNTDFRKSCCKLRHSCICICLDKISLS